MTGAQEAKGLHVLLGASRHLHQTDATHTLCGLWRTQAESVHVTKARLNDCGACRDRFRVEEIRTRVTKPGKPVRVRVWGYRDSTLLDEGFEAISREGRRGNAPEGDDEALVPCLIALLESVGIEVCIGNDDPGDGTRDGEPGFNAEVETWEDRTEVRS